MAILEVGIVSLAVLHCLQPREQLRSPLFALRIRKDNKYKPPQSLLNLKRAANLNKLDIYAITNFKSLHNMQWIGLLKQAEGDVDSKQMKQVHDVSSHPQPWPTSPNLTH